MKPAELLAIDNFQHSEVRQLAWSVCSPLLLQGEDRQIWPSPDWCETRFAQIYTWLSELDRKPDKLTEFLAGEKDRRLGARFERLLEFWLTQSPLFDCLHRRLQWVHDGRTQGEFDFLVKDNSTQQTEHWEVAAKFYVGIPNRHDAGQLTWVGPGKRDRLLKKFAHVMDRQLALGQSAEAQEYLSTLDVKVDRVRAFIKGRLFYPLAFPSACSSMPALNAQHERGLWCEADQLAQLPIASCRVLQKESWLDPAASLYDHGTRITPDEIPALVALTPHCLDVVLHSGQRHRMFIVANDWFNDVHL